MTEKQIWNEYMKLNPHAEKYSAWSFGGGSNEASDMLAQLVLSGKKTATASAYPCYIFENEPLPEVGEYSVILNTNGDAVCIIKSTRVYTVPFTEVSAEHALKEGEGDLSLSCWRECHSEIFTKELADISQTFTENMPVVCEEFERVYPVEQT